MSDTEASLNSTQRHVCKQQSTDTDVHVTHQSVHEINIEPLGALSEVELAPSTIADESIRVITAPYLRQTTLPQGTVIDRYVTCRRGLTTSTKRHDQGFITERVLEEPEEERGDYDPSILHSPLRPGFVPQEPVETTAGTLQVSAEGESVTQMMNSGIPPFISGSLWKPATVKIALIPWRPPASLPSDIRKSKEGPVSAATAPE